MRLSLTMLSALLAVPAGSATLVWTQRHYWGWQKIWQNCGVTEWIMCICLWSWAHTGASGTNYIVVLLQERHFYTHCYGTGGDRAWERSMPHARLQRQNASRTPAAWPHNVLGIPVRHGLHCHGKPWERRQGCRNSYKFQVLYTPLDQFAGMHSSQLWQPNCPCPFAPRHLFSHQGSTCQPGASLHFSRLWSEKSLMHLDKEMSSPLCQHSPMLGAAAMLRGMIFREVKFQSSLSFTFLISPHKFIWGSF